MLEHLTGFIIHFIQTANYFGVFALMALGSALVPIPSEIVLPFTGFLTSKGTFIFPLVVIVAALGDIVGSLIGYAIGYFIEESVIVNLIKKHGKYVLLSEHDYLKASSWFKKYGNKIVFVAKLIPGLRYFISIPAGALKMNLGKFITYAFLGSLVWCSIMIYIGVYLGNRWNDIGPYVSKFHTVIVVIFVLLIAFYINEKLNIIPLRKKK